MDDQFWLRFLMQPHPFSVLYNGDDGNGGGGDDGGKGGKGGDGNGGDDGGKGGDDGGKGGDGGGDGGGSDDVDKSEEAYQALLKTYNDDHEKAGAKLQRRNFALRESNRELTTQVELYKKHGKPSEIATVFKERDTLKTYKEGQVRKEKLHDVAAAAGYDPVVLYDQLPASVETFIVLEGKEGEEKTKVAKVKYKEGEETKTMLLHDYAKVNMARYLPALELAEGTKTKGKKGTMFTKQHADGGGDDQKSRSASILGSKYARKKKE